jgi:hypothetical protein
MIKVEHEAHNVRRGSATRLYDRLIRDFFGRVVPGMIVLLAIAVSVSSFTDVMMALERGTVWMWLIAYGAGWLTAFAVLAIGRRFNLVLLSPDATLTDEQYWAAEEHFRSKASRRQHAEYDRLVTLRDATAAASVSLLLALAVLAVDFLVDVHVHESPWAEIKNVATAVGVLIVAVVALQLTHREYLKRAWRFLAYSREVPREGPRGGAE